MARLFFHDIQSSNTSARTIHNLLTVNAQHYPQAMALTAPGRLPLSYGRLLQHIDVVTDALHTLGVGRHERVALVLPQGPEMAVAFLAVASVATCAPLNPAYQANEFALYLTDLQAKAMIVQAGLDSPARAVAQSLAVPIIELAPIVDAAAGTFTLTGEATAAPREAEGARPDDVALVLHTSGTTARPKIVPLTHTNLCRSAQNIASALELTDADRCLNVMPLFHIHGLVGALLSSLAAGASVVCTPGFHARQFFAWQEAFRPTWYTAVPTMHQALLTWAGQHRESIHRSPLRFIRSCSAALPPSVSSELEQVFNAPVIEAYGMTEAAHQIASNPLPPRQRHAGSVGLATGGEVAIMDEAGRFLPAGQTGEIVIRGAQVTSGYADNPEANAQAFVQGWLRTGDQGVMDAAGYIFLTGRLKEMINRGGEKIAPREIDEVLLQHPAVAQAVTFAMPHAQLGEEVAAAAVLHTPGSITASALQEFVATRLAAFKVPRQIVLVDDLPKGATGKVQRLGLAEKFGLRAVDTSVASEAEAFAAPTTPLEEQLAAIWMHVLGSEHVSRHDDFFRLGGDSILATQFLARVRDTLHAEVSFPAFFALPTIAGLAQRLATAGQTSGTLSAPVLQHVVRQEALQLSFAQQRLWFLAQLYPDSPAYNRPLALRLHGPLDHTALEQSLNDIVKRHEVLRATFPATQGQPVQCITPALALAVPVADLQDLPAATREAAAQRLVTTETQQPFDLTRGPLVRAMIVRLDTMDHVLLVVLHHLVFDAWSAEVLLKELATLYEAYATGHPASLPALLHQYADFVHWQHQSVQGERLAAQLAYWQHQLAGVPAVLDLPMARPRPLIQTFHGERQRLIFPQSLCEALRTLSRQQGVTLFMTLLAAFKVVLQRYSGQTDMVVGVPTAGRLHTAIEGLIGCFLNTLTLRTEVSGSLTFREFLQHVCQVVLDAYTHQEVPFEKVVEVVQPERDLSRPPLFQVLFNLENIPRQTLATHSIRLEPFECDSGVAQYDIVVELHEAANGLVCDLVYNTDLFDAATMARMLEHFQTILQEVAANPQQRLQDLSLLTTSEQQQMLVAWNATDTPLPPVLGLHQLFEAQVDKTPDTVALVAANGQLTYRELNRRANQLAHYLQTLGVGPEVLVGICVEPALDMVVGLLGILKAGGAYVPLDPAYPKERLAFMLQDTQLPVLLTAERFVPELPAHNAHVVCLDTHWDSIAQQGEENPVGTTTPESLAYVMYTSGSTGRPKGVLGLHRSAVNRFAWMWTVYPFGSDEVCCQKTSLNFVDSVWEIFGPLLQGVRLVIMPSQVVHDPPQLVQALATHKVTRLVLVPSLLGPLLDACAALHNPLPALRLWISSGEPLTVGLCQRFRQVMPGSILLNLYGSSEVAADVTCYDTSQLPAACTSVPLGQPIANTQMYLLDTYGNPVPVGLPGELYAGGAGVARGYLYRPELTAEKFLPDPFSATPGARLYKTGDLARYLPDGTIEFLGRADHQVKIRGVRIELGEIEAILKQHPSVHHAVVVAREEVPGDTRLVVYIVPMADHAASLSSDVHLFLQQQLPTYMLPSAMVILETLPLTPNGKIDRRALPSPAYDRPALAAPFVAPRSPVEEAVASVWTDILRLEQVGVHDNFFDLGGHSLLATQVMSRIRNTFHVELPLHRLFAGPTVASLARCIAECQRGTDGLQALPILPVARQGAAPLSGLQERLWFLDQWQPDSCIYNIPAAFHLTGGLDIAAMERSVNDIVRRHDTLRTTYTAIEGQPVQVVADSLTLPLPVHDLQPLPETARRAELQRLIAAEFRQPFDLTHGPLCRVTLLRLGEQEHVLLLVMHHIIADGWSLRVFLQELATLYTAYTTGQPAALAELPIQYADVVHWQRQCLATGALAAQLTYWRQHLATLAPLELPTDHPRPPMQTYQGAHQSVLLSGSCTEALKALSRTEHATLFMTVLAAFKTLLYRYTGQDDIAIGCPIAHRQRTELEPLIGALINTLVLRTDLSGNPSFREVLRRVREICVQAYAHQDVPFEELIAALQPEHDPSRAPLVQVLFNFRNFPAERVDLAGLTLCRLPIEHDDTAKFDLTLYVAEADGALTVTANYNSDLFAAATISRMLGHLQTLVDGIIANPEERLAALPLLTAAEVQHLMSEQQRVRPTNPFVVFPREELEQALGERFVKQVHRAPHAIAVKTRQETWTYEALNRSANRIAHTLLTLRGAGEERVALLFHHEAAMIAALLGALKAGKTYVPLDPSYPRERLAYMLQDAQASVIVTNTRNLAVAQTLVQDAQQIVNVDADRAAGGDDEPALTVSPDTVAYILYTSGSTGQPKGVMQSHRNVLHHIRVYTNNLHICAADRLTQFASYSFDAAVMDIFGALLNGATLYPINIKEDSLEDIVQWCREEALTIYHSTPTVYRYVVNALPAGPALPTLRLIVLGGEEASRRDVELYKQHFAPSCLMVNGLGPTESTVTLQYFIDQHTEITRRTVPLGWPVEDTEILLLDSAGAPTAVVGEIAICSPYVALGYWRQPELTQSRFLPAAERGRKRIYRTGDIGRFRLDGTLEFVGRTDHQVKIRGFRIELGEIETVLAAHPDVREVVVVAHAETSGDKRLAAYLVPRVSSVPTASELRAFVRQRLPEYMVPAAFVTLAALPLTPTSKIDRLALPVPESERTDMHSAMMTRRDALDLQLTQIWEKVLGITPIGLQENFFDLGGHSLLAVQLFDYIERLCGKKLPLATLFQAPTIEHLAHVLRQDDWVAPWSSLVAIQPGGSKPPLFCVHAHGGDVLFYRDLATYLGADQPFYALQAQGLDGTRPRHTSIPEMARHYVQEIRTLQLAGPYFLGGFCMGARIAFEMAQQLQAQGQDVALLAMLDAYAPGFRSALPQRFAQPYEVMLRLQRLWHHLWNLTLLDAHKRHAYIATRTQGMQAQVMQRLRRKLQRVTFLGSLIQRPGNGPGVFAFPRAIHRSYMPQVFAGRITVFRPTWLPLGRAYDPTMGWGNLAADGVEIYEVPGYHNALVFEPRVRGLATLLRSCLAEAHAAVYVETQSQDMHI